MNLWTYRGRQPTRMALGLLLTAATLGIGVSPVTNAQTTITCNGVPATIIGTSPGFIDGTSAVDVIVGTSGNDHILGRGGNDLICAGDGDDINEWNPGDGNDQVEGQEGTDTLQFNGSATNERIDLSTYGTRLQVVRNNGAATMDVAGTEQVTVAALGGADALTVNDLTGTGVDDVVLNLEGVAGRNTGDRRPDIVVLNGADADELVEVVGEPGRVTVQSNSVVRIRNVDARFDLLTINAQGGNDVISASTLPQGVVRLALVGGSGDDTIFGSQGSDLLVGGDGNDVLNGRQGADILDGGAGDDELDGDFGIDILNGGPGTDTGSNGEVLIDIP